MYNVSEVYLLPGQELLLQFPILVSTSLPALCIVYGMPRLYNLGLSYKPTLMQSNDVFLHIIIKNRLPSKTLHFAPDELDFECLVILPGIF